MFTKSDILYELGKVDRAIKTMDLYITNDPEFYGGYYRRGFYKQYIKDYTGAIEDYTTSIILNPNNAYSYIGRADMYRLLKTVDIRSPKTGISVHFSYSLPMAMQIY